jgi:ABC-type multidrug transport system fused ATPase/permease subunit
MDSNVVHTNVFFESINSSLNFGLTPLSAVGIFMIVVFAFRAIFAVIINRKILLFCRDVQVTLRASLMSAYQSMSYEEFTSNDSSDAINNTTILTMYFTNNVLYGVLKALSELLLALFLFVFLISVNGLLVLILSVGLGCLVFFYSNFFKSRMIGYGKKINSANSNVMQSVKQAFEGFKEVKVLGKEDFFRNRLIMNSKTYGNLHANAVLITTGSRYFIEFAVIVFFVVCIFASDILISNDSSEVFGMLGMFAFAAIRLLPGVNVLSTAILHLRSQKNTVDRLHKVIKNLDLDIKKEFTKKTYDKQKTNYIFESIRLVNVCYAYPKTDINILDNINIEISRGEAIGIVGTSGSGKTTLIDVLLGLLTAQSGEILVNGVLVSDNLLDLSKMIAYIPQESLMINESLRANIQLDEQCDNQVKNGLLKASVKQAQLDHVVANLPDGLQTNIGESGVRLSGGQRQRVSLARAIFHSREILIFDEATSALDSKTETEVVNEIIKMKELKTMIIIAHRTDTLKFCDRIYKIENGRIIAVGSPDKILGIK